MNFFPAGQCSKRGQLTHLGLRAVQTARPWWISRWDQSAQSSCGTMRIRSCSIFTASVSWSVSPRRLRQAGHVRVDGDADVGAERVPEYDVSRLAPHAGEGGQLIHRPRDLAAVIFHQRRGHAAQALGLVAEEAGRLDVLLHRLPRGGGIVCGGLVLAEQVFRDLVHALVGALRRQDRRHQQLQRRAVVQAALGVGICPLQDRQDRRDARCARGTFSRAWGPWRVRSVRWAWSGLVPGR